MSTIKVDTINTRTGSGNITFSRPTVLTAGDIVTADIAAGAITLAKIGADAIDGTKIADNAVDSEHYTDASIDEAHIANDAINFATHLKAGTDGQIISWDASGDPVAVGPGTDGQVLTSTGAGSPPAFEDAGGGGGSVWTVIGTIEASDDASLTITGISASAYDTIAIALTDMHSNHSSAPDLRMRFGTSSGILTASQYNYHGSASYQGSGSYSGWVGTSVGYIKLGDNIGHNSANTNSGMTGMYYINTPGDGTISTCMHGTWAGFSAAVQLKGGQFLCHYNTVITLDRIQCYFHAGNIATGRMTLWGVNHA